MLLESVKAEYSPSQYELAFEPTDPLEAADRHTIYKLGVREICRRHGVMPSFLAKWDERQGGQSCHLHLSLADDEDRNVFADGDSLLRHFVGVQRHVATLFVLWAPYPNSYKRLRPGTFAPSSYAWGWTAGRQPYG